MGVVNVQYWLPHLRTLHPQPQSPATVVRAPLRMMARWQSRAGMSLEFTPPLLHSRSQSQSETSNAITTSSSYLFLFGLLWLILWVVIIILILWSPIKIVSISRLSSWNAYIFPGSHPISAITNECPISPSNEVLCETRPWCHAAGDDQSRSRDDVLLDWSYFNRGVPCALFVNHSKMCLYGWMDWKRISPVDLNGCDQVY